MAESVKGYPMKKGKVLTVKYLKQGTQKNGKLWQCFNYTESKKNAATGKYQKIASWSIFINNPINNLKENDKVIIESITSVTAAVNYVNGKEFLTITINCDVKLDEDSNNTENFNFVDTENPFNFNNDDIDNLNISDDDLVF